VRRKLIAGQPKTCNSCGILKQPEEYYINPYSGDGRRSNCIPCAKQWYYDFYWKNHDRLCAKTENWRRLNLDKRAASLRKMVVRDPKYFVRAVEGWRCRYPLKAAAHQAVRYAVKGGHLQREPCAVCGAVKVQAHHRDYSKPLEVEWLCSKHRRATPIGTILTSMKKEDRHGR
jgi:hypothetical protein